MFTERLRSALTALNCVAFRSKSFRLLQLNTAQIELRLRNICKNLFLTLLKYISLNSSDIFNFFHYQDKLLSSNFFLILLETLKKLFNSCKTIETLLRISFSDISIENPVFFQTSSVVNGPKVKKLERFPKSCLAVEKIFMVLVHQPFRSSRCQQ